jgi:integrase
MNTMQAIKDRTMVEKIKKVLMKHSTRDYMLFVIGVNTGFRISDILKLQVSHVKEQTHITIREEKTEKIKKAFINPMLRAEINRYIERMRDDEYLFKSQKGVNRPISRIQAFRILDKAAKELGLSEIGNHGMRKTFGYFHYQKYHDVALLQKLFNHSAPSVTLRYIGVEQDEMDQTLREFFI